jgi:hypothetical protein
MQSQNDHSMRQQNRPTRKGRFTGERAKALRPETHRRAVELLAEPREQVPYDHICRLLRVSEPTLKAIEKEEFAPIAERKQALLRKAMRIANKAADRIEDQIDSANITQATVAFGVTADKINLLSGDPTIHVQHSIGQPNRNPNWLYDQLDQLAARISQPPTIEAAARIQPLTVPALPNGETISDSGR